MVNFGQCPNFYVSVCFTSFVSIVAMYWADPDKHIWTHPILIVNKENMGFYGCTSPDIALFCKKNRACPDMHIRNIS